MLSRLALLLMALAGLAFPQSGGRLDSHSTIQISLPEDSPLGLLSADWGESRATDRGGALLLDLHTSLSFRNATQRRIRGVTLQVIAQEVTPGGKASVSVPSLEVGPQEAFPIRIDLRLLRPGNAVAGPLVVVTLDGVLFDDLSFYGPNKLNSRRSMIAWELEARRDRRYFKAVLDGQGPEELKKRIVETIARLSERPRLDVQMARAGRATAAEPERTLQFAFLRMPDAPVEAIDGVAVFSGNEARAPKLEVRNKSDKAIRYLEIGWILRDREGGEHLAGAVPAELNLMPGQRSRVLADTSLKLTPRSGQPLDIESVRGFINHVEFADGRMWVPGSNALSDPMLKALMPSPEAQRLAELYRKKGLNALIDDLRRY